MLYVTRKCHFYDRISVQLQFPEYCEAYKRGLQHPDKTTDSSLKPRERAHRFNFHTLAPDSSCNEPDLKVAYLQGLNEDPLLELAYCDDQVTHNSLIDMSILLDALIKNHRVVNAIVIPVPEIQAKEPMQYGQIKLDIVESQRRHK